MQKILIVALFTLLTYTGYSQKVRVKENSRIAKMLARINKEDRYAITFGKTIFISCTKEEFFASQWWVNHELTHVQQYRKLGLVGFFSRYLFYSMLHRYPSNPLEKEAVDAEFKEE